MTDDKPLVIPTTTDLFGGPVPAVAIEHADGWRPYVGMPGPGEDGERGLSRAGGAGFMTPTGWRHGAADVQDVPVLRGDDGAW